MDQFDPIEQAYREYISTTKDGYMVNFEDFAARELDAETDTIIAHACGNPNDEATWEAARAEARQRRVDNDMLIYQ
jgi:hypothetical protein